MVMKYVTNTCPACGGNFEFLESEIGREWNCPHCKCGVVLQPPPEAPLPHVKPEEQRIQPQVRVGYFKWLGQILFPPPSVRPVAAQKPVMLTKQIVLIFSVVAFLACGICPPWVYVFHVDGAAHIEMDAGYALIFSPPSPESHVDRLPTELRSSAYALSPKVAMSRLGVEWVCVCALTGVAWFFVPKSKRVDGT